MWWMDDIVVPAVLIVGVSCFVLLVRSRTRRSMRNMGNTAESMYANYADSIQSSVSTPGSTAGSGETTRGSKTP